MINPNLANEVLQFLEIQAESRIVNIPASTVIAYEGDLCNQFNFLISGKIKVYKVSEEGKLLTLYHINSNEACILTTASIMNHVPLPAMAETITDCKAISIPAAYVRSYFDESSIWRDFIFSILTDKMSYLVKVVNDLAFHQLDERLYYWLKNNNDNSIINSTHQEIAEQLASTREVISRSLKSIEKQGQIKLSRGKITLM